MFQRSSTGARIQVFLFALLVIMAPALAFPQENTPDVNGDKSLLRLLDSPNLSITAKNISQTDEDGRSIFGIGLDWEYKFERTFKAFRAFPDLQAALRGNGYVSLNDPNSNRSEAKYAANFNSIVNEVRLSIPEQVYMFFEHVSRPPPIPQSGESEKDFQKRMGEWKKSVDSERRALALKQARNFTAVDAGLQARSESNQGFDDTQFALGGSITVMSNWLANRIFFPLSSLVPEDTEEVGRGQIIQSPQIFAAIEAVLSANHRKEIDGADDDEFARFRFEVTWKTELLFAGLYPFVNYHLYREINPPGAIKDVEKRSTDFVEFGASYYFPSGLGSLGGGLTEKRDTFVTVKYATGRLPPYLENDNQASLGIGIEF